MSKQISPRRRHPARVAGGTRSDGSSSAPARTLPVISLCLATVLCASLWFTAPSVAQRPSGAGRRPSGRAAQTKAVVASARTAALVAATGSVLKETSSIRELPILRQVTSATQSRAEIERMLIKNMNEETTPAEFHASEVTLKKLGLAPPEFQLREFLLKVLTEQVAGYYEPKSKRFYLADWIDPEAQKPVMAHELTHALQDQHFNLRRFTDWPKGDSDAEMAAYSLVEGDASLAMELYITHNPLRAIAFLKSMAAGMAASEQIDRAPRVLRDSLLFPYMEGRVWAKELYKRGGWSRISKAFSELPKSTEQIMHAEKYFANDLPVKVHLPDIKALLGPGWQRIDYDVNGEWGYYLILDEFLKSREESTRGSAGWGGDRFAVYEQTGGPPSEKTARFRPEEKVRTGPEDKAGGKPGVLLVQLTVWDTEKDAREFFNAYVKRTERRYPGAEKVESQASGVQSQTSSFRTSEGAVVIERRGSRILILEGVPEGLNSNALIKSLWQG